LLRCLGRCYVVTLLFVVVWLPFGCCCCTRLLLLRYDCCCCCYVDVVVTFVVVVVVTLLLLLLLIYGCCCLVVALLARCYTFGVTLLLFVALLPRWFVGDLLLVTRLRWLLPHVRLRFVGLHGGLLLLYVDVTLLHIVVVVVVIAVTVDLLYVVVGFLLLPLLWFDCCRYVVVTLPLLLNTLLLPLLLRLLLTLYVVPLLNGCCYAFDLHRWRLRCCDYGYFVVRTLRCCCWLTLYGCCYVVVVAPLGYLVTLRLFIYVVDLLLLLSYTDWFVVGCCYVDFCCYLRYVVVVTCCCWHVGYGWLLVTVVLGCCLRCCCWTLLRLAFVALLVYVCCCCSRFTLLRCLYPHVYFIVVYVCCCCCWHTRLLRLLPSRWVVVWLRARDICSLRVVTHLHCGLLHLRLVVTVVPLRTLRYVVYVDCVYGLRCARYVPGYVYVADLPYVVAVLRLRCWFDVTLLTLLLRCWRCYVVTVTLYVCCCCFVDCVRFTVSCCCWFTRCCYVVTFCWLRYVTFAALHVGCFSLLITGRWLRYLAIAVDALFVTVGWICLPVGTLFWWLLRYCYVYVGWPLPGWHFGRTHTRYLYVTFRVVRCLLTRLVVTITLRYGCARQLRCALIVVVVTWTHTFGAVTRIAVTLRCYVVDVVLLPLYTFLIYICCCYCCHVTVYALRYYSCVLYYPTLLWTLYLGCRCYALFCCWLLLPCYVVVTLLLHVVIVTLLRYVWLICWLVVGGYLRLLLPTPFTIIVATFTVTCGCLRWLRVDVCYTFAAHVALYVVYVVCVVIVVVGCRLLYLIVVVVVYPVVWLLYSWRLLITLLLLLTVWTGLRWFCSDLLFVVAHCTVVDYGVDVTR